MGITRITDHADLAAAELPAFTLTADRMREFLAAIMAEVQRIEDLSCDCIDLRMLDAAEGAQLEVPYGVLAQLPRLDSDDDDEYRALLKVAIRADNSDGCAEDVIWVASGVMRSDARYHQEGTANYRVQVFTDDGASLQHITRVLDLMRRVTPVGVQWELVAAPVGGMQLGVTPMGSAPMGWVVCGDH